MSSREQELMDVSRKLLKVIKMEHCKIVGAKAVAEYPYGKKFPPQYKITVDLANDYGRPRRFVFDCPDKGFGKNFLGFVKELRTIV